MSAAAIIPMPGTSAKGDDRRSAPQIEHAGSAPYEEVAPWPDPVAPRALLDQMRETLGRHIIADPEVFSATVLWIAQTYLVDLFDVVALLVITAPEMRCGKSEFRRLIGRMVKRPVPADNMSAAVLFRCFDLWHPTLLVDEYDTFVKGNDELRGVFNAGHQRGGCVWRCTGEDFVPTRFDVFGAKVLAGIGRLPPTLADRGIILPLRRKLPHEQVASQRDAPKEFFRDIQSKLERVAHDYAGQIAAARPRLPDGLSDRARDNWEPLFQIASVAGGDWPSLAHSAALRLSGNEQDAKTIGVELLSDIHEAFSLRTADRISSSELISRLCDDEEKRWATYNRGHPITPTQVAKRLREYDICSKTIRVNGATLKGYFLAQFEDAFARYVFADQVEGRPAVTASPAKNAEAPGVTAPLRPVASDVARSAGANSSRESSPSSQGVGDRGSEIADGQGDGSAGTRNADVTVSPSPDEACDGVTAEAWGEYDRPRTPDQEMALCEFTAMLLQERLDTFIDDQGNMNFAVSGKPWPEEIPFDVLAGRVKDRLRHGDSRHRSVMSRQICRQLVERGDLVLHDDQLSRPLDY